MPRRPLLWVLALAAAAHLVGMGRAELPAQDGLKFIRVAQRFQTRPWAEVVRGTDQHPLYPAAVALAEPLARLGVGRGPDAWRLAAQGVSMLASLALLVPLYWTCRHLFDETTAALGTLLWALLPLPAAVGHDTLSDPLALLCFGTAFACGAAALRPGSGLGPALGCGVAAGLGYLTRPEVALAPLVLAGVGVARHVRLPEVRIALPRFAGLAAAFLALVGSYALVKGEVSEKLALRRASGLPPSAAGKVSVNRLPPGLDGPEWDFSPKEETGRTSALGPWSATGRVVHAWAEDLAGALAVMALWGVWRCRARPESRGAVVAALVYAAIFSVVLVRHATMWGYLSGRHTLSLAWLAMPWAAAGIHDVRARIRARLGDRPIIRPLRWGVLVAVVAVSLALQAKQSHPSRWGYLKAGAWLAERAEAGESVLDTRGWAAFVCDLPAYDPWHIGQALRDPNLTYVVVGGDELKAPTRRAASLRALLDGAATRLATFPGREDGRGPDVHVYRFWPQTRWDGLKP